MSEARPRGRAGAAWLAAGGLVLVALLLHRPWTPRPFDVWDFAQFVERIRDLPSLGAQVAALAEYYGRGGQTNVLFYGYMAGAWHLLGARPVLWAWLQWGAMLATVLLTAALLRRLGASLPAATTGAGMLILSTSAFRSWAQMLPEPLALSAALGAAWVAAGYQASAAWRRDAALILAGSAAVLFTREVMAVTLLLAYGLAACRRADGALGWPDWRARRTQVLVLGGVLLAAAWLALALRTLAAMPSDGYAADYGRGGLDAARWWNAFRTMLAPAMRSGAHAASWLYPSNLLFVLLVGVAAARALAVPARRARALAWLLGGLLVPVVGATAFLPWPWFRDYYATPFVTGSAVLMAFAVDEARHAARAGRVLAALQVGLIVAFGLVAVDHSRATASAVRTLNDAVARRVAALPAGRDVLLLVPGNWVLRDWELMGYMRGVLARPVVPAVRALPCGEAAAAARGGEVAVVSVLDACGRIGGARVERLAQVYRYLDWTTLRPDSSVVWADVAVP